MNLIRFVPKNFIEVVPKDNSFVAFNYSFQLPNEVLMGLRHERVSLSRRADGTLQFPRVSGLSVSDPLSTSVLHLLANDGVSNLTDEAAD